MFELAPETSVEHYKTHDPRRSKVINPVWLEYIFYFIQFQFAILIIKWFVRKIGFSTLEGLNIWRQNTFLHTVEKNPRYKIYTFYTEYKKGENEIKVYYYVIIIRNTTLLRCYLWFTHSLTCANRKVGGYIFSNPIVLSIKILGF